MSHYKHLDRLSSKMASVLCAALLFLAVSSASALSPWLSNPKLKLEKMMGRVKDSRRGSTVAHTSEGIQSPNVLTEEQIEIFERDGVLLIRGLVSGEELKAAIHEVETISKQKSTFFSSYKNINFQTWRTNKALEKIALFSSVPKVAAQLINHGLKSKGPTNPVRLLKDAVLCFADGGAGCGWHVDDGFFWPCHEDSTGVNVWIALSSMPAKRGGGLAVSPGSHKEKFAKDAIPIIRAGGTCGMEKLAPDAHKKFEDMAVVYDMEPGDAIIHDRWLFHRSDGFKEKVSPDLVLNRYSIRYMPEDARALDNGYDEVYKDKKHIGKDGQPLKSFGGYYPQVFPSIIPSEMVR